MINKAIKKIANYDEVLKQIILSTPEPHVISTNNVFNDLMSCIIEQQIHYRSTKKIYAKLLIKANIQELNLNNFEAFEKHAIPTIKLSLNKFETIERVVDFFKNNNINWHSLNDDEVIKHLSSIKGIGAWTIDMILMYTLERPNIFPVDDFHLKQIMTSLYQLNPAVKLKAQMLDIAKAWERNKSLVVKYLFEWKKLNK